MHQQLLGYKVEEKLYLGVGEQKKLNTTGLRSGSSVVCLLELRVRIPPGAWMSVVRVVCCQVEVSASGLSLVQRSPTECGVSN